MIDVQDDDADDTEVESVESASERRGSGDMAQEASGLRGDACRRNLRIGHRTGGQRVGGHRGSPFRWWTMHHETIPSGSVSRSAHRFVAGGPLVTVSALLKFSRRGGRLAEIRQSRAYIERMGWGCHRMWQLVNRFSGLPPVGGSRWGQADQGNGSSGECGPRHRTRGSSRRRRAPREFRRSLR